MLCKVLHSQGLTPQYRLLVVGGDKRPSLFTCELGEGCLAKRTLSPSSPFSVPALPLIRLVISMLQVEMKLIILEHYSQASEWAAKYIRNRIIQFNPGPDKYFTLGLPTGMLWKKGAGRAGKVCREAPASAGRTHSCFVGTEPGGRNES